ELWVASDPYKHRAMRICGEKESLITGDADDFDRFAAWSRTLPKLAGNPLYFWSMMELERVFGITEPLTEKNARDIYEQANEKLGHDDLTAQGLLKSFHVEYAAPCVGLADVLSLFDGLSGIVPSFRGDDALNLRLPNDWQPKSLDDLSECLSLRLQALQKHGCQFADHALDSDFVYQPDDGHNNARFESWRHGKLPPVEMQYLQSEVLRRLANEYARLHWVLQLHVGALRKTSDRLRRVAGPAGGYATIGNSTDMAALTALLNDMERSQNGMPRIILYPLSPNDLTPFACLTGSFTGDGVRGQIRLGPAWWYCDHRMGIRECLAASAAFGVLSVHPGMTTDSRSLMSFVRHDYYRRVMCDFLAEQAQADELPRDMEILKQLASALAYDNAKQLVTEMNK
ncbi:MAG: glucuronate isomerase, partial [Victivallales bacterium]|nr:glucuronate isomerase [Victivallales bacterium]